jgi:hypothetical protein
MGSMEQQLDSLNLPFLAKGVAPPWLPAPAAEARRIAYWAQWVMIEISTAATTMSLACWMDFLAALVK